MLGTRTTGVEIRAREYQCKEPIPPGRRDRVRVVQIAIELAHFLTVGGLGRHRMPRNATKAIEADNEQL